VRLLGVDPGRITVTHLAADERFSPGDGAAALAALRERYDLPRDQFLLQLGTLEPRKNLATTLEAFRRVAAAAPDVGLAVVGPDGWGESGFAVPAELETRVHRLGRVPDEDLPLLYRAATALVYPSLYEGFGLPPLEAMQSGCPVITSETSSLPEVVGDAALLVAPRATDALATAMRRVIEDEGLRAHLSAAGIARARRFSWARTAEATLDAYDRAVVQRAGSRGRAFDAAA
jgi:glycosyltransferase involved in cell wall biosynthesis